ncbi:MAG: FecR domain-containing protein [Phycisphaeraceae bacterium]|nr:FecR domain-containing protein [Phycisphaeraceae bacterium]
MPDHLEYDNEFTVRVLRYLDASPTDTEAQELAEDLKRDPVLLDRFVSICYQEQLSAEVMAAPLYGLDNRTDLRESSKALLELQRAEQEANTRIIVLDQTPPEADPRQGKELNQQNADNSTTKKPIVVVIPHWVVYGGIAAMLAICFSLWQIFSPPPSSPALEISAEAEHPITVARILRVRNAVWAEGTEDAPGTGAQVMSGQALSLDNGLVELEMLNGAKVLLQGPVSVQLESEKAILLNYGRLSASVYTRGKGFDVLTSQATITDLGTEFGVEVDDQGQTRLDVFNGEVELALDKHGDTAAPMRFTEGGAAVIDKALHVRRMPANELHYVLAREFNARVHADKGSAYHRWLTMTYMMRRDPEVVVYYLFDRMDADQFKLINRSNGVLQAGDGRLGDGHKIATPQWVSGRFQETRALRFGVDDRGRCRGVVVPDSDALDITGPMTIAMWVKLDPAHQTWNTLVSKREIPPMRLNYQFSAVRGSSPDKTRFQFGAGTDDNAVQGFQQTPEINANSSTWTHLAVTSDSSRLRYFVNGRLVHQADQTLPSLENNTPLLVGTSSPDLKPPIQSGLRPLYGEMSELLIARRELSEDDIQLLHDAGKP